MRRCLSALSDILRERKGSKEHQSACQIAQALETESCLQLAMLADSAKDVLSLTRFFDKETYDVSDVPKILSEVKSKCQHILIDGGCLQRVGGHNLPPAT